MRRITTTFSKSLICLEPRKTATGVSSRREVLLRSHRLPYTMGAASQLLGLNRVGAGSFIMGESAPSPRRDNPMMTVRTARAIPLQPSRYANHGCHNHFTTAAAHSNVAGIRRMGPAKQLFGIGSRATAGRR